MPGLFRRLEDHMADDSPSLPRLLVTGAAGGIGRACVRLLGPGRELVLTDVRSDALAGFVSELEGDGYRIVAALPGDLRDAAFTENLALHLTGDPFAVIHAAGLSPSLGDWREIMAVNLVASVQLLDALEPWLVPGSVAVLVSSASGYRISPDEGISALLADPLDPAFLESIGEAIHALDRGSSERGTSYSLSKYGMHRLCERRAVAWGRKGARIVSVSPTLTATPMGASEIAHTPAAGAFVSGGPVGRMATAMEVALVVRFLIGRDAAFITGSDVKVDGGSLAARYSS